MYNNDLGIYSNYKRIKSKEELMNPKNAMPQQPIADEPVVEQPKKFTNEDKMRYDELKNKIAMQQRNLNKKEIK
tara:strand:- start:718 stop:939 length:222 start_codon:yes stop_codon:yes gene_type:complete